MRSKMRKASPKRPSKRLSPDDRLKVGFECQDLTRKQIKERAEREVLKLSKHAQYIEDELAKLDKRIADGIPRSQAVEEHAEKMANLRRPNTKRLYEFTVRANKAAVIKEVSRKWCARGYHASQRTVRRCWEEADEWLNQWGLEKFA